MSLIKRDIRHYLKKNLNYLTLKINKIPVDDTFMYVKLFGRESVDKKRFCNISAGGHFDFGCGIHHPCWINVDLDRPWKRNVFYPKGIEYNPKKDIAHDLLSMVPIPIESESMELVHSRLSIEHIHDEAALIMFKEVHRMLKERGVFRVCAANIDLDYSAYQKKDTFFYNSWFPEHISLEQRFIWQIASYLSEIHPFGEAERISDDQFRELLAKKSIEEVYNYCSSKCSLELHKKHRSYHINWWNPVKLQKMLSKAGFTNIILSTAGQSISPVLRNPAHFDNLAMAYEYASHVFYMEAIK